MYRTITNHNRTPYNYELISYFIYKIFSCDVTSGLIAITRWSIPSSIIPGNREREPCSPIRKHRRIDISLCAYINTASLGPCVSRDAENVNVILELDGKKDDPWFNIR